MSETYFLKGLNAIIPFFYVILREDEVDNSSTVDRWLIAVMANRPVYTKADNGLV